MLLIKGKHFVICKFCSHEPQADSALLTLHPHQSQPDSSSNTKIFLAMKKPPCGGFWLKRSIGLI
jgi:hypothetical protein